MFKCFRCRADVPVPRISDSAHPVRCNRCGAVHSMVGASVDIISPPMAPMGTLGRVSPWMLPWTRPVMRGDYECRFGEIKVVLFWTGSRFTWRGDPVAMRDFTSWRGVWT